MKLRIFCKANDTINWKKQQPTEYNKTFTKTMFNIVLIFKIYKELMKLYMDKTHNPIKKWDTDLNREFMTGNH